ncbi:MAG: hypothetical protein ABI831_03170 [Betaproteobacteria bacterium]
MLRKILFATMVAASIGSFTVPSAAAAYEVAIQVAPPPLRYEAVPSPRNGFVWVPGYWDWRGKRHVWVGGTWVSHRPGYRYYEPRWVQRGDHWSLERGRWGRGDRDHDGIRNRYDRDRDGDGVPNRLDRRPDNPRRN